MACTTALGHSVPSPQSVTPPATTAPDESGRSTSSWLTPGCATATGRGETAWKRSVVVLKKRTDVVSASVVVVGDVNDVSSPPITYL